MPRRAWSIIVITVLVGIGFSALTGHLLFQSEQNAIRKEVQKDVNNAAMALGREVNLGLELLYAVKNHFDAGHRLNARNFQPMTSGVLERHLSFKSIEWVDIVMHHQRRHYVQDAMQGDSQQGTDIVEFDETGALVPAQRRDMYFPIRFTSSASSNQSVIGYDMGSTAVTRQALKTSFNTGVPVATPATTVKRAYGSVQGFLLIMPILRDPEQLSGEETSDLRGFLVAVIDIGELVNLAINTVINDGINFSLNDITNERNPQLLHSQIATLSSPVNKALTQQSLPVFFAGREWQVEGYPTAEYVTARQSYMPYWVFAAGTIIFIIISYLLYRLQLRTLTVQAQVDQKTRALRDANTKLESMTKCDGLTGLYNRSHFEAELEREIQRALREETPLSLMIVEVERLSDYNLKYGRLAGDQVLRRLSEALDNMLKRPGDLLCRYSGSQFVAILPRTEGAQRLAEECLLTVKRLQLPFEREEGAMLVDVYVGGVTLSDHEQMTVARMCSYGEIALARARADEPERWHWMEIE
ncbi:hypothetical protein BZG83_05835 [Salinivibrio sp. PR919]|nr:hypothetical protein BZG83_05835 [Salinivibrio sp. PR919]OOF15352.1 hypothetical protein BZG84_12655 [Salinivibrio sp. PR932]